MAFFRRRRKDGPLQLDERPAPPGSAPRAMVAAAMPMSGPGVNRVNKARQQDTQETWQTEGWYFFDAIGELRGPLVWIANAISQADIHATAIDPDTGKPTGPSDDPVAQAAAAMVLGGAAQRAGLLRLIALCWQVAGEVWVIVRPQGRGKPDQWLALSGSRVKPKGGLWTYTDPFTGETITLGLTDRLFRLWNPHPENQAKADSAVRSAIPVCREIEKASQNIAARLDSRLAINGLGALADELDLPRGDHPTTAASVMDQLLTAAEYSLNNPGQASAQIPLLFNAPGELIASGGAFAFFDLATQFDGQVVELRTDAIARLGAALDMPKDVAQGNQGEANHWSAWQLEESTYKIFVEPLLKAIGDAVTSEWYRGALVAMGKTPEQAEMFEIGWDTTAIVARPDDTENLRDLHDRILISDEYMLTENGVPLDAMPSQEEHTRRLLEKAVLGAPSLLADPSVTAALDLGIEIAPAAAGVDAEVTTGGELEAPEPEPAPEPRALPGTQGEEPAEETLPAGLTAAAGLLVGQALDRAGGRLLTNQNRGQFKDVPRHRLYEHIRPSGDVRDLIDMRFVDETAAQFGMRPARLRAGLGLYLERLLSTGEVYDQDEMRWYLR